MAAEDYLPISNYERRELQATRLNAKAQIHKIKKGEDYIERLQEKEEEVRKLKERIKNLEK